MADASIKWERERDPLYTRLSERNNKRLSTFYSFLAGGWRDQCGLLFIAEFCPALWEILHPRRYTTGATFERAAEKRILYPGEQQQHVYRGRMMAIYSSCCATLLHQWTFIHPEWREEQKEKREKSADDLRRRFSFFFFFAFTVAAPLFPCQTQKKKKKGRLSVFEARSMRKIACVSDTHRCQSLLKKKEDFWLLLLLLHNLERMCRAVWKPPSKQKRLRILFKCFYFFFLWR